MAKHVWVLPRSSKSEVPIGACVLGQVGSCVSVRDDDLNEYWVSSEEVRPMHPTSVTGVEDMTCLGDLQEYSILRNLQIRYRRDFIYTYVGSILIAVNPYKPLPIYGKHSMAQYRKRRLGDLPPHIFAVADHSYESMRRLSERRCIVVSGESGGGKTESTKLLLQYLAAISPRQSGKERQILDSNPILEAFGNAKTVCNDNSSRFGKYISICFNADGSIHGAKIKHYLLEKSRIVSQSKEEDNYHIFYALLRGLAEAEKQRLQLKDVSSYKYLSGAFEKHPHSAPQNPNHNIKSITSAMKVLNFTESEIWSIFELIAAILHFGNIDFETILISNVETVQSVAREMRAVCSLLQIPEERLKDSLTRKTIHTQGDNVVKFLSKQEAKNSRDAFAKKIFGNLFNFIVDKINENLAEGTKNGHHQIGILDIFGFEAFDRNSFEQLCINYANEKLQQFFTAQVLKVEQEQYASEGIVWEFVEYPDNQEILDLIEAGPQSVLSVINDSTKIPRGTDQSMLEKLVELHSDNPFFLKPRFKSTPVFGIQHYAGIVLYDTKNIIDKNHDSCSVDIKQVVLDSGNDFLRRIFTEDFEEDGSTYYKRRLETLASKFKSSLDSLLSELNESQPFFVRCIKPNDMKKPGKFDRMLCCKQLRYSGMTEVTKVREAGYPVRHDFFQFVQQYRILVPGMPLAHKLTDYKGASQRICQAVFRNFPNATYQLGRRKIFLRHSEEKFLEDEKERVLYSHAVVIQKLIRGWLLRTRYLKLKKAVVLAENCWLERRRHTQSAKIRHGFHRLQAKLKSRLLIIQLQKHIRLVTRFQARCRGYLIRRSIEQNLEDAARRKKPRGQANDSLEFKDFARSHFRGNQDHKYCKKAIRTSLTSLGHPEQVSAAKAIWVTILRYTGNMAEPRGSGAAGAPRVGGVGAETREILQGMEETKARAASESEECKTANAEKMSRLYEKWLKRPSKDVEKLHFVIGHGIKLPQLRDEIYCQICKVLTKNPSTKASLRAWELLSCCIGCFPPSPTFLKYLKTFVRNGHDRYTSFCLFRLHRLLQNGCRTRPPFTTELRAIARQKPVQVEFFTKNGAAILVKIDSATTAREMLDATARTIKLRDTLGFVLVLVQGTKELPLGAGSRFVMDAVSECEEYVAEVEGGCSGAPWRVYLKKEMFAPWHDFSDEVATNLIYGQIREGVAAGVYGSEDPELASVVSRICYAEAGKVELSALKKVIGVYAPVQTHGFAGDQFEDRVAEMYQKAFARNEAPLNAVRTAIVKHAASNWTLDFSTFFNLSGSATNTKCAQPCLEGPLLVGLNFSGISVLDESNQRQMITSIDYPAIQKITLSEDGDHFLTITSYEGVELSLSCRPPSDDFRQLLDKVLRKLQKRSKFVMSLKDFTATDKNFLDLQKGDLITLSEKFCGEDLVHNCWGRGVNDRTGKTGNFLLHCVDMIAAVQRPDERVLKAIRDVRFGGRTNSSLAAVERQKHYTLEAYAEKMFGAPQGNETSAEEPSELWKCSKHPLQLPLLANLASDPPLAQKATQVFGAILQYADNEQSLEDEERLTRQIFGPALENDDLRDETYCQVMKQLTSNGHKASENKMWELMWLLTGLFGCGEALGHEVRKFLQSRRTIQIARECLGRFGEVLGRKGRKCPPHLMEVEAAKKRPCHIFHRVFFPDGSHKFVKVHSLTKFLDLKEAVASRLKMDSAQEFCLCVETSGRLFLGPEDQYLFDYLHSFQTWAERKETSRRNWQYKIHFMKYTWDKSFRDRNADLKFTFPQEYNKYIQGYYKIPRDDIIQFASLLYGVFCEDEKTQQQFPKVLEKLVPSKAINLAKSQKWQDEIETSYNELHASSSGDECRIKFLKHLTKFASRGLPYFALKMDNADMKNYILYSVTYKPLC